MEKDSKMTNDHSKKYRISYVEEITEEELREMTDEGDLESYLWECLRPEGDDWEVEEIE